MNKIKVIDLLNMISKGEEVPKKIYYKGDIWYLEQDFSNRLPYYKNGYNMDNLLSGEEKDYFSQSLNDEVEIIEKEKKIPEKLNWKPKESMAGQLTQKEQIEVIARRTEKLKKEFNNLLDYLKSKGDE